MRLPVTLLLSTLLFTAAAMPTTPADMTMADADSMLAGLPLTPPEDMPAVKRHPWIAAAEVTAINLAIMGYDHYYLANMPCYNVTAASIKENLQIKTWWWDRDYFHTNAFNHPYHGSLYYTAARDNGLSIAVSSLYAFVGSTAWEIFCESEHPAINDIISTPVGGIALGEPMHRISGKILDDRKRGLERVGRELLAALIDPMRGINRLARGDAWRVSKHSGQRAESGGALRTGVEIGIRHVDISEKRAITIPYIRADVVYGDATGSEGHGPFDYFALGFTVVEGKQQQRINCVTVKSQLWSQPLAGTEQSQWTVGIYHHYDYFNTLPETQLTRDASNSRPYGYLEIGSAGPGVVYSSGKHTRWEQQLFVNGIALGATPSDCEHKKGVSNRRYSFGSGYGARLSSAVEIGNQLRLRIDGTFSQLFCWDGFYADDPSRLQGAAGYSVQGERGNVVTLIAEPHLEVRAFNRLGIGVHGRYFRCHSNYKFHPHATTHSWELHAGARYFF